MQHEDFDVASLAAYLHLDPQQVDRLAKRGKLPGRRVGGKWRFSPAEIHHWMEERLGLLDDTELAQVESAMHPDSPSAHMAPPAMAASDASDMANEEELSVAELLSIELIDPLLAARSRSSVIKAMSELATSTGLLWDAGKMAAAVRAREELASTAMDSGVALLHPRRPLPGILGGTVLALGRSGQGIPFGGSHGLTDLFWLIGSIDDRSHLRLLARISRLLAADRLLDDLRAANDAGQMYELLIAAEEELK